MDAKTSSPSLPFKSKKILHSNSKSLLKDQQSLSSKTPEKPAELRTRKRKAALSIKAVRQAAESVRQSNCQQPTPEAGKSVRRQNGTPSKKLPHKEKFEILSNFFDSLVSTRPLRFQGLASNFSDVCPEIEFLTDRRFSYGHLAQLKFILPEAIELKEVRVFDEQTDCLKPDLHISFNFEVLDNQDDIDTGDQYMRLKKLFKARLSEFANSHPEIDDVPKHLLPKPFNCPSQDLFPKTNSPSSVKTSISSTNVTEEIPFHHHSEEIQGFHIIKSMVPMTSVTAGQSKQKEFISASHFSQSFGRRFSQNVVINRETERTDQGTTPSSNMADKVTMSKENEVCAKTNDIDSSTPSKLVSTPARLMAPPKRSPISPDDDSSCFTNKLVRRPPCSRSLVFDTPTKEDKNEDQIDGTRRASIDDDLLHVLTPSLLQSIREKERKAKEEQSPAISQAKRRKKMIANLPKLFNAIYFLFHKRTVITKEELIYKIIVGNVDIVDRREIEEQLDLLLELVPEWISEKLALSGDVLVCIDQLSSAETVRARLEEAK